MKLTTVAGWSILTGVVMAAVMPPDGVFGFVFYGTFFGGIAAAVLVLVRASRGADYRATRARRTGKEVDPWTDEMGVHRYEGDVLDVSNHPRPGVHGHI